jgi:hypothetical protein
MTYHRRTTCRVCGAERLRPFQDLGPMPLANAFLSPGQGFQGERTYPLQVCLCAGCGLVQTPDVVDPEILFQSYPYLSGISSAMGAHFRACARRVVERLRLVPGDLVVEVASNDGTLLESFRAEGVRTLGVEPAVDVAERARRKGIETVARFFDVRLAEVLRAERGGARVVVANNVLAHVDEPVDFLSGCRALLDGGAGAAVVVEVPWLGDLVGGLEYDTIYHEHLCYFSVTALLRLFSEAGLAIDEVERLPVHGGSLRVWASPRKGSHAHGLQAMKWLEAEREEGLADFERLSRFAREAGESRQALVALLKSLRAGGASIAACGAPAKGNALLNACRIGPELVEYVVDKSPLKVGSLTPGMHLPVLPVSALEEKRPDYALLLAWNLQDEMREQHRGWLAKGGRFIVPIPRPEVLA